MNAKKIKIESLQRVSVVGTSCSGKTTFAEHLAQVLSVRHIELDALSWLPDLIERPKDEFAELVEKAVADNFWVCDGNYSRTRETVWGRTTAIVWLNYSFPRTFYRAVRRTIRRVSSGDSILLWVLTSYHEKRRRYAKLLQENNLSGKEIYIFQHPRQAENFLRQIRRIND